MDTTMFQALLAWIVTMFPCGECGGRAIPCKLVRNHRNNRKLRTEELPPQRPLMHESRGLQHPPYEGWMPPRIRTEGGNAQKVPVWWHFSAFDRSKSELS